MIQAELHKKLGRDSGNASDRLEDLLTSSVLGSLRYLPPQLGITPFLRRAVDTTGQPGTQPWPFDLGAVTRVEWFFWERGVGVGEVDLVLVLHTDTEQHAVALEAKYLSGKSSYADVHDDELEEEPDPSETASDQLAKYLQGLQQGRFQRLRGRRFATTSLLYLTAHTNAPSADLADSRADARRFGVSDPIMLWASWLDLDRALRHLPESVEDETQRALLLDVLALLHSRGLQAFRGITLPTLRALPRPLVERGPGAKLRFGAKPPRLPKPLRGLHE